MPSAVSSSSSSSSTRTSSPTKSSTKSSTSKASSALKTTTKSKTDGVAERSAEAAARTTKSPLKNNGGVSADTARAAFEAKNFGAKASSPTNGAQAIDKPEFDTKLAENARTQNRYSEAPNLDAVKDGSANLQIGHRGEAVKEVQRQLNARGANLEVDGYLGPKTEAALKTFQNDQGLSPSGIVDKNVTGKLVGAAKTLSAKQWNHFSPDYGTKNAAGPNGSKSGGSGPAGSPATGKTASFLNEALSQKGKQYVYGAEASSKNNNPRAFDCSELVEWAAKRAGGYMPDGSANQLAYVRQKGTQMSVADAMRTPGALLFRPGHVAISLGDGRTIEARGRAYGVGIFSAKGRFTSAGMIPGMS